MGSQSTTALAQLRTAALGVVEHAKEHKPNREVEQRSRSEGHSNVNGCAVGQAAACAEDTHTHCARHHITAPTAAHNLRSAEVLVVLVQKHPLLVVEAPHSGSQTCSHDNGLRDLGQSIPCVRQQAVPNNQTVGVKAHTQLPAATAADDAR